MTIIQFFTQNEYAQFFAIIIVAFLFAKVFYTILIRQVKKITDQTNTDIDDMILKIIKKPFHILIVLCGVYFGLKCLSALNPFALWLDRIFFVMSILIISYVSAKILSILISRWLKVQQKFEKTPKLIAKITSILVYLIALLLIMNYFEIEITPLIAGFGIGGLAIGLALQSTLSNFFAGLHIISDRPVNIGDYIQIEGDLSGYVEDIGWRSTRIKTLQNKVVIIPNSKLAESVIINESMPELEITAKIECGVGYGSDLDKVEKNVLLIAKEIQKKVEGAITDFQPLMRFSEFGDSNIKFYVILRVKDPVAKYEVKHQFIKALKKKFDQEQIEISWPVRKVFIHNK